MADDTSEKVWKYLETMVDTGEAPSGEELIFHPETGELVALERGAKKPAEAIVVGQAAKSGFWLL